MKLHSKHTCSPKLYVYHRVGEAKSFTSLVAHGAGAYLRFL